MAKDELAFQGRSFHDLQSFPASARAKLTEQLRLLESGLDPDDWKPMSVIGPGVREIRSETGQERFVSSISPSSKKRSTSSTASRRNLSRRAATTSKSRASATAISEDGDDDVFSVSFDSVWDAVEPDPVEAERLTVQSDLMIHLREFIKAQGWTQKEAARTLGVTQPRVSNLMRLKTDVFSIDSLIAMIARAGLRVDITVRKKVPPRTVMRDGTVKYG